MSYRNRIRTGTLLMATVPILLMFAGCGGKAETASAHSREVKAVTGHARLLTVPRTVSATGSLQAGTTVMVSTRMMGWVREVHVTEGQHVSRGEPLLAIDDTDLQARKSQAQAGITEARAVLTNADKMLTRFENLYAEKSVSGQQLDDVRTGRDRAAAGLEMARAGLTEVNVQLSYLDIKAPVDGIVTRKMIEAGNMANPGLPLISMESLGDMKVVAHLGEKDISSVALGTPVTVTISSLSDTQFHVPLTKIVPTANPGSRTYDIEARLNTDDARLKSGMFARVSVPIGERQAVVVPAAAVARRGQLTGVWLMDDDRIARLRWVRLGHPLAGPGGESYEILAGLSGDETVILSSEKPLTEGDRVVN